MVSILKLILWAQYELDKKNLKYPKMNDLATARIDPKWVILGRGVEFYFLIFDFDWSRDVNLDTPRHEYNMDLTVKGSA